MHLVLLHGAPATGKHTIGRELAARTGFELYHNHLVVDAVLARHAFGSPGFVAERDAAWRAHLAAPPAGGRPGRVFTFNPENSVPQAFIDWLFADLPRTAGLRLHSVAVTAPEAAIEARLAAEERRRFRKLTDLDLYRRLRAAGTFLRPTIPRTDLAVDSTRFAPADAAAHVAAALGLPAAG